MFEICWQKLASNSIEKKTPPGLRFYPPCMEFMIFYAFVIALATVASAPVGNDQAVGVDGGVTLCDFTTEDCPLVFDSNDYTTPSTGLDQTSGGAPAEAEAPPAFSQLNFFTIANSDALAPNGVDPDPITAPRDPALPQTGSATYECEKPPSAIRKDPNFFNWPSGESPVPVYQRRDSAKKLPVDLDAPVFLSCQKCGGPKGSDCTRMFANCGDKRNPYTCHLCPLTINSDTKYSHVNCEFVADISKLPSKGNPYGQSWCKTGECQAWGQHCNPLLSPLTLDCL